MTSNRHQSIFLQLAALLALTPQVALGDVSVSVSGRVTVTTSSSGFTNGYLISISGDGSTIIGDVDTIGHTGNIHYQSSSAITGDGSTPQIPSDYTTEEGSITFSYENLNHSIQNDNLVFIPGGGYTITNLSTSDIRSRPSAWSNNTQTQTFLLEDGSFSRLSDGSLFFEGSTLTDPGNRLYASPILQTFTSTNQDGSTIVGNSVTSPTSEAFKWTEGEGVTLLGDLIDGSVYSTATAVNADGTIVVGAHSLTDKENAQAYWWSADTGKISVGKLEGDSYSTAYDVSGDGLVVVGVSGEFNGIEADPRWVNAFRWSKADGIVNLGNFEDYQNITAASTNKDGSIVVGATYTLDESKYETGGYAAALTGEAYMWSHNGKIGLGHIRESDIYSSATRITPDAAVIIGISSEALECDQPITSVDPEDVCFISHEAFRWTEAKGMQSIGEWLLESGYEIPSNTTLQTPTGVSDDGTVVIGNDALITEDGITTKIWGPWVARGDRGFITIADFTESFSSTASIPQAASSMPTMALHGAHHQPLLAQKRLSSDRCAWINGDFANYHDKKADSHLVEAGICKDPTDNIRAGIGIGKSKTQQTLDYSGSSDIAGRYILGEFNYLHNNSTLLSTTMLHGRWDADINRGYLNAGTEDLSSGSTSIRATAIRGRIDWRELYSVGDTTITPKIEYTLTRSEVDGYTETTGGFPARFDPQSHTARESRLGIIAENDLTADTTARGIAEVVHRFDKSGAAFSGEVVDMFPFSIPGSENRQDWVRLGGEIDYQVDQDSFISFSLMRSSRGEDADVSGALSWKTAF